MTVTTRPATDADKAFAREAHHLGYHDVVIRQFGEWDEARQDAIFDKNWANAEHKILLCEGVPCGYVSVEKLPDYTHVRELVVHSDHQRRGIGTTFLRQVIKEARSRGVSVKLGVLRKNPARYFYRKLGFKEFDWTDTHFMMERSADTPPDHAPGGGDPP